MMAEILTSGWAAAALIYFATGKIMVTWFFEDFGAERTRANYLSATFLFFFWLPMYFVVMPILDRRDHIRRFGRER